MIEINIAKDFAMETGARTEKDGTKSGEEFFKTLLKPKFAEALKQKEKLKVILDGNEGLASSFINEAFRLLADEFGAANVRANLVLISNEIPRYIQKVNKALDESKTK